MVKPGANGSPLSENFGHPRHVMLAVDGSPESKAAVRWATQNMLNQGDQVLAFHAVKELKEIPTAMGMAPFQGASPEMQQAHMKVAEEQAEKLVQATAAYCQRLQVKSTGEYEWCQRREAILNKVMQAGITHLVMGTGKSGRKFGFLRKESLTTTVTREAQCQVLLIDKKGQLVGRSSYNAESSKRFPPSVKAPESLADSDSEPPSPFPLHGRSISSPSHTLVTQSSLSSASSNLGEIEDANTPPFLPAFSTPPPTPDSLNSPVTVLLRNAKGLQRTNSVPSPLSTKGGVPRSLQNYPPERTVSGPERHSVSSPNEMELLQSDVTRTQAAESDVSKRTAARSDVSKGAAARSDVSKRHVESPPSTSRTSSSDVTSSSNNDEAAELALLRAEVHKLRLVSEMRAREAQRFAQRLEATQTEADAVAIQLAEESKRRKAAERTASDLVTILGTTAPEKVVDILPPEMQNELERQRLLYADWSLLLRRII